VEEHVTVGRVTGVFGTRGWVKVLSHTRPRDNLMSYTPWFLRVDGEWRPCKLNESRHHHGVIIASLEGVTEREQARALVRSDIAVLRSELPPLGTGEYYWSELIGLRVVNLQGQYLGRIAGLLETSAHDVIRVVDDRERLIPFVTDVYVFNVDCGPDGEMVVDWHVDD
jgi:16S rRNA processing protein RimM